MFFRAYPDWSLKHVAQNYLFILIYFYRNIVCQNVSCKWGLNKLLLGHFDHYFHDQYLSRI